jgi:hypothetical protein
MAKRVSPYLERGVTDRAHLDDLTISTTNTIIASRLTHDD